MKLLYVTEATGWTGGANQIWLTSQELIKRGHEVRVACAEDAELGQRLTRAGVPVEPFRIRQDYDMWRGRDLARIARARGIDLIHAHHPRAHGLSVMAGYLLGSTPIVVTRRVIFPIKKNIFSLLKYRVKRVDRYVAVCLPIVDRLAEVGVDRDRISVIPSGIDVARWEAVRRARAGVSGRRPWVVTTVGHYAYFKGQDLLLEAAARVIGKVPDVRFRFVGRDTQALAGPAERAGVGAHVELLGERADIPELLADSHLFVMPSLSEGIGTALIEASAAGLPVVATDVGGLPEVVENGVTGTLVTPNDPGRLAQAILRCLEDYPAAEAMAERGRERVTGIFSVGAVVGRLLELYEDVRRPA